MDNTVMAKKKSNGNSSDFVIVSVSHFLAVHY